MKSLQDLGEIKRFLERSRNEQLIKKEYGYLIQDLEFLEMEGALKLPVIPPGKFMTVRDHWVALKGYFDVNDFDLEKEGLARRFIINTPSVRTPVIALDTEAWKIYSTILQHSQLTRYQAMCYLVYILEVLMMTESPLGDIVDEDYIHHVVMAHDVSVFLEAADESCLRLQLAERFDDPSAIIPRILREEYCLPSNNWIFSDGSYFLMSLPSWTLSSSNNYVENWDFFTC